MPLFVWGVLRLRGWCRFLDDVFNRYIRHSAWALVDETHKTDQPWAAIFDNGKGNHQPIPRDKLAAAKVLQ